MIIKKIIATLSAFVFIAVVNVFAQPGTAKTKRNRVIIVMFDGLRPDYITADFMPHLYAFKKRGSYGNQNHSVYPTVTRVNSASYATGSYPAKHGLMGNTVYFPEVNKIKGLNTGDASELMKIAEATSGHLLTAKSLGEMLADRGERMIVFSSGSTGQAFLQNHKLGKGAIINPDLILPASFKEEVINSLGTPPPNAKPNVPRHKWIIDAFMRYGLAADGPLVSAIWFSDPDGTAHAEGIGSPLAMQSIKEVDAQFGRIIDSLERKGLSSEFNILVSTDHGFVTNAGKHNLVDFLIEQGVKKTKESDDVVVAEGAIYVKDHNEQTIKKIVSVLQAQEWVGPIFTKPSRPGDLEGTIKGTLSFDVIHWNHPERAADILMDENWDDRSNGFGFKGTSLSRGIAGHGGASPYEIHIPLLLDGPSFKKNFESEWPTSNVDITPTVLYLCNIPLPATIDGRVLSEMLVNPPAPIKATPKKQLVRTEAKYAGGTYNLTLERTILGDYQYFNFAKVTRSLDIAAGK